MLKRYMLGLVLLVLLPAPAQSQLMYYFARTGSTTPSDVFQVGPGGLGVQPSSFIRGALPTVGAIGEVAVTQAILSPGQQVPLPVYADGTQATDAEVFWTANLWLAHFSSLQVPVQLNPTYDMGDACSVSFTGRTYNGGSAVIGNFAGTGAPSTSNIDVLVTVVAVRAATPSQANTASWGKLKSLYRN